MADLKLSILDSNSNISHEYNEVSAIEMPDMGIPEALNEKYIYLNKLGKGSQGQVWLAQRKSDGERVAIKQLNVHSVTTWKQYELFKREARILESLNMDGVVPFYEYIEDLEAKPPFVCIIQKFIEGQTLGEMLKAKHRFETEAIYDIIAQVLGILQKLHTHEPLVVHRDIKPSNLMLTPLENGRYKVTLLDFGAVANPQVQNGGSTVAGTYGYMPPEQLMGQAQPASDIYALAALAVEMLSGTSPADIAVCDFKLVIEPYLQHLPKEVVQTLSMMLEPAVENRICDHTALMAQFDALANKKEPSLLRFLRRTALPKLEDVESICQPGNYEIWQNLDQSSDIEFESCPCHLDVKLAEHEQKNSDSARFSLCFILFTVAMLIVMSLFATGHPIAGMTTMGLSVPISIFLAYYAKPLTTRTALDCQGVSPVPKVSALTWKEIHQLLNQGQKVVGQISAIYYQNIDEKYDLYFKENRKQEELIAYDFPKFWVIYRFKFQGEYPFEFYGELLTYTSPEGHYKIGDPITLVADISVSNRFMMQLSVVPYPYPFGDVWQKDNIVYTCDFNKASLMNGDVLACEKQLKLHCLSSLQFEHNSVGFESISNAEQSLSTHDSANFSHQNIVLSETKTEKVEVYPHRYLEFGASRRFYSVLAERYLKRFESGDEEAIMKAADIYQNMLNDNTMARELYWLLLDQYIYRYVAGDDKYFSTAQTFYNKHLYLKPSSHTVLEETTDYRFYSSIAERLVPKLSLGEYRYIHVLEMIYRDKLNRSDDAKILRKLQSLINKAQLDDIQACMQIGEIYALNLRNGEVSNGWYQRAIDLYLMKYKRENNIQCCLKAAAIYKDYLNDEESAQKVYYEAIEFYFKKGSIEAWRKITYIFRHYLNIQTISHEIHQKMANVCLESFDFMKALNTQFALELADLLKNKFSDTITSSKLYRKVADTYMEMFVLMNNAFFVHRAVKIYKDELSDEQAVQRA
ncbi:MAG: protein kinase, partial [Proteobacteria bacterium]|nr:protein kinase [Pseudomonadota bacterium]